MDKYPECFSDRPGFCDVIYHEVKLKPNFIPKQLKTYRIPEILKPELERQIDQLVEDEFLVPSKSPMSCPILCVFKNNKEVRLVCDYRYTNSSTVSDAFPMQNVKDVINNIRHSNIVTKKIKN